MTEEVKDNGSSPEDKSENYEFTAEIQKLLDILVHSLYTQKEIFLRELVSNAADAIDKARFRMLTEKNLRGGEELPLEIEIGVDKDNKILTISDTGIGMTKQDIVDNIGTIAHSGSLSFLKSLEKSEEKPDLSLIGQFGIGFYSVYMVADKVEIVTLSAEPDSIAYKWVSDGKGSFTITPTEKSQRGTEIHVHLKEDASEFLETHRIKNIIQQYSDFVSYPIKLEDEVVNKLSAVWRRSKNEVKEDEYEEFFKYLTHMQEKPLAHIHLSFDAPMQFRSILFVPRSVPWDMQFESPEKWRGIHLYAKRVFIKSDCEELMPPHMRFIRGVVDSDDLPLNISRETLQENQLISKIRKNLVKKVLDTLEEMSEENVDDYKLFWQNFGKFFKQGYRMDYDNRDRLAGLYRFNSSKCEKEDDLISLKDYIERMPESQKDIYYATGENRQAIEKSPHLEIFTSKGIEVLYLTDPVDDFLFEDFREYQEKKFASIDQDDLSLDDIETEKKEGEDKEEPEGEKLEGRQLDDLLAFFKTTLKDRVTDVRISKRLLGSPCCLVTAKDAPGVGMQKIMKMMNQQYEMPKRVLEINPKNPIIIGMGQIYAENPQEDILVPASHQLLDNALLLEGSPLDTREMVPRIQEMMERLAELLAPEKKAE